MQSFRRSLAARPNPVPERVYPGISATRLARYASAILVADGHARDVASCRRRTVFCRSGTAPSCAAESWARSCVAGASASAPSKSGFLRRDAAAPPGSGARRSLSSPASASLGTRGSSRDATFIRRHRCSTRSPGPCSSTAHEHSHLFTLAGVDGDDHRGRVPEAVADRAAAARPARALPGLRRQRPLRPARLQPHVRELPRRHRLDADRRPQPALARVHAAVACVR